MIDTEAPPAAKTPTISAIWGTGRRKTSIARVRLVPGMGRIIINGKPIDQYFSELRDRHAASVPLQLVNLDGQYDVFGRAHGGGTTGQAGAIQMGIARALVLINRELKKPLYQAGCLTRDSRMKERKKYGQRGARRRFQFSKR